MILVRAMLVTAYLLLLGTAVLADDDAPPIPLQRHLRMLIRPTLLGLVPPADPEGYGAAFVRVLSTGGGSLNVRYEIKELTVDAEGEDLTRIRHGDATVHGLTAGDGIAPPLFWPDGDFETASGLLWLPRPLFDALSADGAAPLGVELLSDDETARAFAARLARLRGETADSGPGLELELLDADERYSCWVNGERLLLPALRARDSLSLAEYLILSDRGNPLVLKMSFIPPAAGEEQEAAAEPGLMESGAGYAIVEINF